MPQKYKNQVHKNGNVSTNYQQYFSFSAIFKDNYTKKVNFNPKRKASNITLLISAFVIVSLILWNTNSFFKKFKEEERLKMEIWATAQLELIQSSVDQELGNLTLKVMGNNTSTPMILVNEAGTIKTHNISEEKAQDSIYLQKKLRNIEMRTNPFK